jgi:hypothetical protein
MSLFLASVLIFLAAGIGLVIGGWCCRSGEYDQWTDLAYENSQLLHQRDELEAELNAMKGEHP